MSKPRPPKKKQGAPAYMAQYAALMTILLAFFILLLTMGQEKSGGFKDGIGSIRNIVGFTGGSGVMDFWRSMRNPGLPPVDFERADDPMAMLIGYEKDAYDRFILPSTNIDHIEFMEHRRTLLIRTPIRFEQDRLTLRRDSRFALDHASTILYTLDSYQITVGVIAEKEGCPEESRLMAARRAAWIARHIIEHAPSPEKHHIRSLGMARGALDQDESDPAQVVFLLRNSEPE